MEIGHIKIERSEDESFLINNKFNRKFIKMGARETNYLLKKLGQDEILDEIKNLPPLSAEQKKVLDSKFFEWGFYEKSKTREKRELSNFIIFELKPDTFIHELIKLFQYMISPPVFFVVILSSVLAYYSIGRSSDRIMAGVNDIQLSIGSILVIYLINFLSACIHEICHEAACFKYTGRIGRLGIKLFYMLPAFFCDVSDMYLANSKKKCFYISAAGVMSNIVAANLSIIIFGCIKGSSELFLWIYIINICNVVFNLIPFAKFDGYWIMKSLTGINNLYDKSVSLLYMLVLNCRGYRRLKVGKGKKVLMTLYGTVIYAFHWCLWIYSIYAILGMFHWNSAVLEAVVTLLLIMMGLTSCILYTEKYYRNYKQYLYMEM